MVEGAAGYSVAVPGLGRVLVPYADGRIRQGRDAADPRYHVCASASRLICLYRPWGGM